MASKIFVKDSLIHGRGIFAKQDIKVGEIVGVIKGTKKFKVNRSKDDALANPDWIGFEINAWIDPVPPYKYLNHSCNPSTAIRGKKTLVAIHNIKKNTEITIDYSIIEADSRWFMSCSCGSHNCRHVIKSIRELPEKFYKNYFPYISKDFQILYNNSHYTNKVKHGK